MNWRASNGCRSDEYRKGCETHRDQNHTDNFKEWQRRLPRTGLYSKWHADISRSLHDDASGERQPVKYFQQDRPTNYWSRKGLVHQDCGNFHQSSSRCDFGMDQQHHSECSSQQRRSSMRHQPSRFDRNPGRADRDMNWRASKEGLNEVSQPNHLKSTASVVKDNSYNNSFPDDQRFPRDNRWLRNTGLRNKWHSGNCEKSLNSSLKPANHKGPLYWISTRTSPTIRNWCSCAPDGRRTSSDSLDFTHTSSQEYPKRWRDESGIDCRRYVPILGRGY